MKRNIIPFSSRADKLSLLSLSLLSRAPKLSFPIYLSTFSPPIHSKFQPLSQTIATTTGLRDSSALINTRTAYPSGVSPQIHRFFFTYYSR